MYLHLRQCVVIELFRIELLVDHSVAAPVGHAAGATLALVTVRLGRPLHL